jgi:hypothetical protein
MSSTICSGQPNREAALTGGGVGAGGAAAGDDGVATLRATPAANQCVNGDTLRTPGCGVEGERGTGCAVCANSRGSTSSCCCCCCCRSGWRRCLGIHAGCASRSRSSLPLFSSLLLSPYPHRSRGCNNIVGSAVLTNLQSGGAVLRHARVLRLWAGWCRPSLGGYYGSAKGEQLCCRPGTAVKLLRPAVQVNPAQPEETNCD